MSSSYRLRATQDNSAQQLQVAWFGASPHSPERQSQHPLAHSAAFAAAPDAFVIDLQPALHWLSANGNAPMADFRALNDWQVLRELLSPGDSDALLDDIYRFCRGLIAAWSATESVERGPPKRPDAWEAEPERPAFDSDNRLLRVWYATCRAPETGGNYGDNLSPEGLHYGSCLVHIPTSHQPGSTGSWWRRWIPLVTDDSVKLRATRPHSAADYWGGINAALGSWPTDQRNLFVYLHGYNNSFEDAAVRAAQIGYDLKVPGEMSFFSWPSQDSSANYPVDEDRIEESTQAIADYLSKLCSETRAERIHLFVHSMGNRGLLNALERLAAQQRPELSLGWVFLCAPDVGVGTFGQQFEFLTQQCEHSTLLSSDKDKALKLSTWIHQRARAGNTLPSGKIAKLDALWVEQAAFFELGHGYFAENNVVLADMHEAITTRDVAAERRLPQPREGYFVLPSN